MAEVVRQVRQTFQKRREQKAQKVSRHDNMKAHMQAARCHNCDKIGHYWRDCTELEYRFCPLCGKEGARMVDGHDCPSRPKKPEERLRQEVGAAAPSDAVVDEHSFFIDAVFATPINTENPNAIIKKSANYNEHT